MTDFVDEVTLTPEKTFSLPSMSEMLTTIREAFDNKTLQMFTDTYGSPKYNGPCAIGVCMTQEQRDYGDSNEFFAYTIDELVSYNIVTGLTDEEQYDLLRLQSEHDGACGYADGPYKEDHAGMIAEFEAELIRLEEKYK